MTIAIALAYAAVGVWLGSFLYRAVGVSTQDPLGIGFRAVALVAAALLAVFWLPVALLGLTFVVWCLVTPQAEHFEHQQFSESRR